MENKLSRTGEAALSISDIDTLFCHDLPTKARPELGTILVTGASGYIGGRLVPELTARGYRVRIMVRGDAFFYRGRWPQVEVVVGDALNKPDLNKALKGVYAAYYLIHSLLLGPGEFEEADIAAALNFKDAATEEGVNRIIYLGGLGDILSIRSPHLRGRIRVAETLQSGAAKTTVLRAAVIIGSGSASYEIIHHLVKKVPIIFIPHWARNACQPIGIRDVVKYLVGVLENPDTAGRCFDIGGRDVLTYEKMMRIFAATLDKKTIFIPSPIPSMSIFGYIAGLMTPVPLPITVSLMEGMKDEVVCRQEGGGIRTYVDFEPLGYREAIVRALTREEQDKVHTRWSDAYPPAHALAIKLGELKSGPDYTATFSIMSDKPAEAIFKSLCKIGGAAGWFDNNWMWKARGAVDKLFFGVGTSRGRKSPSALNKNDVIDFWRVEDMVENKKLLLRAEMKLPGRAWLEFDIDETDSKRRLTITAYFETKTIFGKIYWYIFLPFHGLIFTDLIRQIEKRS